MIDTSLTYAVAAGLVADIVCGNREALEKYETDFRRVMIKPVAEAVAEKTFHEFPACPYDDPRVRFGVVDGLQAVACMGKFAAPDYRTLRELIRHTTKRKALCELAVYPGGMMPLGQDQEAHPEYRRLEKLGLVVRRAVDAKGRYWSLELTPPRWANIKMLERVGLYRKPR